MTARYLLALLALLMGPMPAPAEMPADRLPGETRLCLHWAGRSLTFDGSMFGQMLNDPNAERVMTFVKDLIAAEMHSPMDKAVLKHAWAMGDIAWQRPVTAALVDVGKPEAGALKLALLIDLDKDREAFDKQLEQLLNVDPDNPDTQPRQATIGQVSARQIGPEQSPITFGYIGSTFFLTTGMGTAEAIVQPVEGKTLATNETYLTALKQVGGVNGEALQMLAYVDVKRLADSVAALYEKPGQTEPGENPRADVAKAVGACGVTTIAGSWRIVDKGLLGTLRVSTPGPHKGLMSLFDGAPLTEADLATIPVDADFALLANVEPTRMFDEIRRGVTTFGEDAVKDFDANVAAMEKVFEMSLKDDMLASLGDTWTLSMADSQGGRLTGLMLSVEVRDETKLNTLLDKFAGFASGMIMARQMGPRQYAEDRQQPDSPSGVAPPIQSLQVGAATVRYMRIPGEGPGMVVLPAWCVHEGRLYLAGWPQTIASALQSETKPLATHPDYKRLRSKLLAKPSILTWTNSPQMIRKFYPLYVIAGTTLTNLAVNESGYQGVPPLWPSGLPELTKFIWPSVSVIAADDAGITVQSYSSGPTLLPGGVAVPAASAAILLPALNNAREEAKKAVSAANLNGIGKSCVLYQADHGDAFPPDVEALIAYGYGAKLFVSPLSGRPAPVWDHENRTLKGEVDYILIDYSSLGSKAGNLPSPSQTLLAYERPENYRPGEEINALFVDSHVSTVSRAELAKLIEAAKKAGGTLPENAPEPNTQAPREQRR
ncbi:MAG: hypothetical protein GVY16_10770 [Planctomycetes bacterium]|jgi:hypothetical protein|nr:hypothetical protein [Planctomycetota bacterium]